MESRSEFRSAKFQFRVILVLPTRQTHSMNQEILIHSHSTICGHRTILIATDFSSSSTFIMDWTAENLIRNGDKIILLHVIQDIDTGPDMDDDADIIEMVNIASDTTAIQVATQTSVSCLEESIDGFDRIFAANKILDYDIQKVICTGAPGPTIVAKAAEIHPNMVIMGTHGRTGFSELIMGSVSSYVNKHCKQCPVVVVKSNHAKSE
ncbi:hypothetical protein BDV3_005246 [Batrachochytrium dendrobatidis]|nr:hypothetical protein BDEG_23260 [Batrachochytrium dendrobatidis JEL423]